MFDHIDILYTIFPQIRPSDGRELQSADYYEIKTTHMYRRFVGFIVVIVGETKSSIILFLF